MPRLSPPPHYYAHNPADLKPEDLPSIRHARSPMDICRDYNVAFTTWRLIEARLGAISVIQDSYGTSADGRLAFARDEYASALMGELTDDLLKFMEFGWPKHKSIEFVGDPSLLAPAAEHKVIDIRLNVHGPDGTGNGHDRTTAAAEGNGDDGELHLSPAVGVPETSGGDL